MYIPKLFNVHYSMQLNIEKLGMAWVQGYSVSIVHVEKEVHSIVKLGVALAQGMWLGY